VTRILLSLLLLPAMALAAGPISLSDPDGQELLLESLSVRAAVHGMLSLTELEMEFRSPRQDIAEGRFTCVLPAGATISRFAKEIGGLLMEGEVVERMKANRIYDEILHEMRDPALLEQDLGNRFSARIFPIDPDGRVRLILSWTQLVPAVDGVRTLVIPLRGLPRVASFDFSAILTPLPGEGDMHVVGLGRPTIASRHLRFTQRDWLPEDIELDREAERVGLQVMRAGDYFLASLIPAPEPRGVPQSSVPASWLVYVDTSASSASGLEQRLRALSEILGSLPPGDAIEIVAFDQTIDRLFDGSAGEAGRRIESAVRERKLLGGTDIETVVRDIATRAKGRRVVFVSDGVATQGRTDLRELRDVVAELPPNLSLNAVVLGAAQSAETLRELTRGRGRIVEVPFTTSMRAHARAAAALLQVPAGARAAARDEAAEWFFPHLAEDVRPGREVIVVGKVKEGREPDIAFDGLGSASLTVAPVALRNGSFETLLEREAHRAYLQDLREREAATEDESVRDALAREQVRISIERRILIPRTTLLVLESEDDYKRYELDRRSLASILTVGGEGIDRIARSAIPAHRQRPPREQIHAIAEAITVTAPPATEIQIGEVLPEDDGEAEDDEREPRSPRRTASDRAEGGMAPAGSSRVAESVTVRGSSRQPWTARVEISDERVEALFEELDGDPLDRSIYNDLGEALLERREWERLAALALRWQPYDPENPQVYELLMEAALQAGSREEALRAAGSLAEIAPAKPELLQRAGLLLLRVAETLAPEDPDRPHAMRLALAPLRRAVELRPDRANAHRHLALALWRAGNPAEAAGVLERATQREYPQWYGQVHRVLREELGWIYRVWRAEDPARSTDIALRAERHEVDLDRTDALRITLAWDTDANDVDLHVIDPGGEECWYSEPKTTTLELYEDITQGFGPEVIRAERRLSGTYRIGVKYYDEGPMGIARGVVLVLQPTRSARPSLEIIPFRLVQGGREDEVRPIAVIK
jgi:tetratricopeptide (TPR) repeat protein